MLVEGNGEQIATVQEREHLFAVGRAGHGISIGIGIATRVARRPDDVRVARRGRAAALGIRRRGCVCTRRRRRDRRRSPIAPRPRAVPLRGAGVDGTPGSPAIDPRIDAAARRS